MQDLHDTQLQMLSKLLFSQGLTYTEMKPSVDLENNIYQHHVDQLLKQELIQKEDKLYNLTLKGKQFANKIDNEKKKMSEQPMTAVMLACTRIKEGEKQYLIYTRLKEPWYGCQGFFAGKLEFGEKIIDGAKRELKEETGLTGDPSLVATTHIFDKNSKSSEILSDIIFFLFLIENPKGDLVPNKEGKFEWVSVKDIKRYIKKPFTDLKDFMSEVNLVEKYTGIASFIEKENLNDTF